MFSPSVDNLVAQLTRLPGVGQRTAQRLAFHLLRVPKDEVDKWIAGGAKPPREVFLRAVDLILDETGAAGASNDAPEPPPHDAAGSSQRYID